MRRTFGGNGGGGGGGMLRAAQRTVRTGIGGGAQEPFSHSTPSANAAAGTDSSSTPVTTTRPTYKPNSSNLVSLSSSSTGSLSSPFSSFNLPRSPTWAGCSSPTYSDEFDNWECVDGSEDERERESASAFYDDFVFGSVPSNGEVQHTVSALQQVLDTASNIPQFVKDRFTYHTDKDAKDEISRPTSLLKRVPSVGRESDWIEPSLQLCNPRMLQCHESGSVYDAFHLLQTDPSIQRMVISLSSDKAVWDAVLNNEVVRELRESISEADNSAPRNLDDNSDGPSAAMNVLSWIFDNTKAKVMELIEKITKLVNLLFRPPWEEKQTGVADPFEGKLRTSFLLSVVVLLIVVVSRAHKASS